MLFQQRNDVEFAGVFYYFVVEALAITVRKDSTECLCVCLPSMWDLPVNLSN